MVKSVWFFFIAPVRSCTCLPWSIIQRATCAHLYHPNPPFAPQPSTACAYVYAGAHMLYTCTSNRTPRTISYELADVTVSASVANTIFMGNGYYIDYFRSKIFKRANNLHTSELAASPHIGWIPIINSYAARQEC